MEYIIREITEFIHLPIRHICLLNDIFQSVIIEHPPVTNSIDWKIIEGKKSLFNNLFFESIYFLDVRLLARQANVIFQSSCIHPHDNTISTLESSIYYPPNVTLETSQDTTLQSEISPTIVLQRTNKEPWEPVSFVN